MKKDLLKFLLPIGILALVGSFILSHLLPAQYATEMDIREFGSLPIQCGGRIKPVNTVARNSLLILSGKQSVRLPNKKGKLDATGWLMDVSMRPELANTYKVFRIDNSEVQALIEQQTSGKKYFAFEDLKDHLEKVLDQHKLINPESSLRNTYEQQLDKLYNGLTLYYQLTQLFHSGNIPNLLELEYANWVASIKPGMEAIQQQAAQQEFNKEALTGFITYADKYLQLSKGVEFYPIPSKNNEQWMNMGQALLDAIKDGELNPAVITYAKLTNAFREARVGDFNTILKNLQAQMAPYADNRKVDFEVFFNHFEPFYISSVLYMGAFIIVALGWLWSPLKLPRTALTVLIAALIIHTFGIVARIYLQGRPPVTNLYSSAIFVGWGSVLLGLLLERFFRNGLGAAVASIIGFSTLIIAHNLGLSSGDTLEMVRAVLDSNFWLSTHVIVITLGYSSMFLAGMLGLIYCIGHSLPQGLQKDTRNSLNKMAYGIVCFATLFSFVGTMLGGIWADQSWGRFWGWDPKENGALIIVLWCAIMLHARWGGLVKKDGFMMMAVAGNIVTSWSWFGTNMLGVGLHSYGFMDKAFWALAGFIASQVIVLLVAWISLSRKPSSAAIS